MPAKPTWFPRIASILAELRVSKSDYLDRHAVERIFGVRPMMYSPRMICALSILASGRYSKLVQSTILILILRHMMLAQTATAFPAPDWSGMIPLIEQVLKAESERDSEFIGTEQHCSIARTADITGDNVPEALIYLGPGGESTEKLTVMEIRDNRPVLAVFADESGKVSSRVFLHGGSMANMNVVELLPRHQAVYAVHISYGRNRKLSQCGGQAYIWNGHMQRFEFNSTLSDLLNRATCRNVPKKARWGEFRNGWSLLS